ncbi:unnamed protein product [Cladocopium goreaui]|uniref:Uncharacterized protein n=1 Tax=Cladocopium goreaui TaxID=2562237 RepID=A0A9P1BKR9_9DINO|nr:unnamed protein product [Cladocopium goreaui]
MFPLNWQQHIVSTGDFTVESDRDVVVKLSEKALESKMEHLRRSENWSMYRYLLAHRPRLLGQDQVESRSTEDFLQQFGFESLEAAVKDQSPMPAMLCAIFAGDVKMLQRLVESRADVNARLKGLGHLGYFDTQTPLIAATKSNQKGSLLQALIDLRADVHATTRVGLNCGFVVRSPEHVEVLLRARADLHSNCLPMGLTPLTGAVVWSTQETVLAMLKARCDANPPSRGGPAPAPRGFVREGPGGGTSPLETKVLFDILKRWASNAYHRIVEDTRPAGCPWQALKASFCEVGLEVTESELRRALIHCYMNLDDSSKTEAAERKLTDPLSYFHLARYVNVEQVLKHWNWYLYCLSFESHDFTSDHNQWNRLPEETLVRMPMDFVDLEVLSQSFQTRVTAIQLNRRPVTFGIPMPDSTPALLLVHDGLWAPMLGQKPISADSFCVHEIVELADSLPGYLENFLGETGCTMEYDLLKDCYTVCVGQHLLPVPREHIKRMVTDRQKSVPQSRRTSDIKCGPLPGQAPALNGIPDGEVEFHLLFELVVHDLLLHLEEIKEQLSGRVHVKPDPMIEYKEFFQTLNVLPEGLEIVPFEAPKAKSGGFANGSSKPNGPVENRRLTHMSLREVKELVENQMRVWVKCQQSSDQGDEVYLPCRSGDFICLVKAGKEFPDGSINFVAHTLTSPTVKKWIFSDAICQFVAREAFAHDESWPHPAEEFLSLQPNDTVSVLERQTGQWQGWALAQHGCEQGLVQLELLDAQVYVQQTSDGADTQRAKKISKEQLSNRHQVGYGPLHGLTFLRARMSLDSADLARTLLSFRADVNAKTRPGDSFRFIVKAASLHAAFMGVEDGSYLKKLLVSLPGLTPLGGAAFVGNQALAKIFLEHDAEVTRNDRGDLPEDLARLNGHVNMLQLLQTFAV